jgi:hypothetical protein
MSIQVGVWVDHREAILVKLSESGEETIRIQSEVESQLRRSGDDPNEKFEPLQVPSDDVRQNKHTAGLNKFYDEVISHLGHAQAILIFGPGEARKELRKRMDVKHPTKSKVDLEVADSMSEAQVVAKVRRHFQPR